MVLVRGGRKDSRLRELALLAINIGDAKNTTVLNFRVFALLPHAVAVTMAIIKN